MTGQPCITRVLAEIDTFGFAFSELYGVGMVPDYSLAEVVKLIGDRTRGHICHTLDCIMSEQSTT
jgi:hypothetical protein